MNAPLTLDGIVACATRADPYPLYAQLVQERPLFRDAQSGAWIASSARAVQEALESPDLRVRPMREPVPSVWVGTPVGAFFETLIRTTEGEPRSPLRAAAVRTLGEKMSFLVAEFEYPPVSSIFAGESTQYLHGVGPAALLASFGISQPQRARAVRSVQQLTAALATGADEAARASGGEALEHLLALLAPAAGPLLQSFRCEAARRGARGPEIAFNAVGLLVQSCEATAGLIGNALVALGRDGTLREEVHRGGPASIRLLLEEVLRFESPVQTTRRWVGRTTMLGGQRVQEGDQLLLVLAAANRDPAANPEPARLWLDRRERRHFSFGYGGHQCPGRAVSLEVASGALANLLSSGVQPERLTQAFHYKPSVNGSIPVFTEGAR